MYTQNSSNSAITLRKALWITLTIIGYIITAFFGLILIVGMAGGPPSDAVSVTICFLIFIGIGISLVIFGLTIKRQIKRFEKYVTIISTQSQMSIETIAGITMRSVDFVSKDLQEMIDKKFFTNAYIDKRSNEIVLNKVSKNFSNVNRPMNTAKVETVTVTCNGCGAANKVTRGASCECEFCGSPLTYK